MSGPADASDRPEVVEGVPLRQLQVVANAVPALLAYVDCDARYVWGNDAYQRWFGLPAEAIRGRHVREVLGEPAWEIIQGYVARALAGEEVTFETHAVYRSGPTRDIRANYMPDETPAAGCAAWSRW